jgi:hypothetical protein
MDDDLDGAPRTTPVTQDFHFTGTRRTLAYREKVQQSIELML